MTRYATVKPAAVASGSDVTFSSLLGRHLRLARKARRLTQQAVAEKVGLSRKQLSSFERGRNSPKLSTLLGILDALGVGSLQQLASGLLLALLSAEDASSRSGTNVRKRVRGIGSKPASPASGSDGGGNSAIDSGNDQ